MSLIVQTLPGANIERRRHHRHLCDWRPPCPKREHSRWTVQGCAYLLECKYKWSASMRDLPASFMAGCGPQLSRVSQKHKQASLSLMTISLIQNQISKISTESWTLQLKVLVMCGDILVKLSSTKGIAYFSADTYFVCRVNLTKNSHWTAKSPQYIKLL